MRSLFFYTIGIAFASGIFTRSFFNWGWEGILCVVVTGIGSLLACWVTSRGRCRDSMLFLLGIFCLAFSLGMARMHGEEVVVSPLEPYEGKEVILLGEIVREPDERDTTIQLYVTPQGDEELKNEIILVSADRFNGVLSSLAYGDRVRIEGVLTVPQAFATDGGREFNYPGFLKAQGVTYRIDFAHVQLEEKSTGSFLGQVFSAKRAFIESIERNIPEPHAGLGEGLLLGVKRAIGEHFETIFRETGIIHIVVLSGYNIMLVVNFCMYFLTYLFYPRTRMVIGIGVIVVFALLVGLSATVVRASIMAILLIIAQSTGRTYAIVRALMFAGIIMLLINPYLLVYDPGFQLSFLATLGLILFAKNIEERISFIPEKWGLRNILSATVVTQLFVLPLLLYQTGLFSVVSVIVNMLVLPMVPVAMLCTFVTGILGLMSVTLGYIAGYSAYLSLGYILFIAEQFSLVPFASFGVRAFPFWIVVLVYGVYGVAIMYLVRSRREEERIGGKNNGSSSVINDYEGWTIVEEKTLSHEIVRNSAIIKDQLPFK